MTEQSAIPSQDLNDIPPPPDGIDDPDQIAGAEDRWQTCPLKDCKRNPELLYEDFYLRGIRSNRLMCSACAVRVEMGYMAREEVKKADDRFFQGTQTDNLITFGVLFGASLIANVLSALIGFFYFAFFIGAAAGGIAAPMARRLTKGRVTRQLHYVGVAGIIVGALASTFVPIGFASIINLVICSVGIGTAAWGVLLRRI